MAPLLNINIIHCHWIILLFIKSELNTFNNLYHLNRATETRKKARWAICFYALV